MCIDVVKFLFDYIELSLKNFMMKKFPKEFNVICV